MIYAQSRYENSEQLYAESSDGELRRVVEVPRFYSMRFPARKHKVQQDERMDQIASHYYGDPEMWWVISIANPEIFYPERIPAGTELRIPDAPALL